MNHNKSIRKPIWQQPWGYAEGFLISVGLLIVGFSLEFVNDGVGIQLPSYPNNIYLALIFISLIVLVSFLFKKTYIIRWLTTSYCIVSVISVYAVLVLLIGFIPQEKTQMLGIIQKLGLSHITTSYPFIIIQTYLMFSLGFTIIKRIIPFKIANIGFLLNHLGLWIVILTIGLGSSDLQRLSMTVSKDSPVWYAEDENKLIRELPLALKLLSFSIDEYNPKIAIIDNQTGEINVKEKNNLVHIEDGLQIKILNYEILVDKYYYESGKIGEQYQPVHDFGACPSAYIHVENLLDKNKKSGWISSGSIVSQPQALRLDSAYSLIMVPPEPKKYASKLITYTEEGEIDTVIVEVNKPIKLSGWNLYQLSYDESLGKWSDISIIELIKDPWLPVVYVGFVMMMIGALFLFWQGKTEKRK